MRSVQTTLARRMQAPSPRSVHGTRSRLPKLSVIEAEPMPIELAREVSSKTKGLTRPMPPLTQR
jgi:hypothetical protein